MCRVFPHPPQGQEGPDPRHMLPGTATRGQHKRSFPVWGGWGQGRLGQPFPLPAPQSRPPPTPAPGHMGALMPWGAPLPLSPPRAGSFLSAVPCFSLP